MKEQIEIVLEVMRESYRQRNKNSQTVTTILGEDWLKEQEEDFSNGLVAVEHRRYWKIISYCDSKMHHGSVRGFIVKAGDKKFKEGDMLKASGWSAPARNYARGNVIDGTGVAGTRWTGIR